MEPSKDAHDISWKGRRFFFNRFCIDEDATYELSGVHYLQESFFAKINRRRNGTR